MDAMIQTLDRLNVNVVSSCAPFPTCDRCGSYNHVTLNCQVENPFAPSPDEHVAYVNNFQPRLNHEPYSNLYKLGWKLIGPQTQGGVVTFQGRSHRDWFELLGLSLSRFAKWIKVCNFKI